MNRERSLRTNYFIIAIVLVCTLIIGLDRSGIAPAVRSLTDVLFVWAILLGAFALLLGVANVAWVHLRRIVFGQTEWYLSLALIISLLVVLAAGLFSRDGADSLVVDWFFNNIIAPGQSMLFSLLAFFMAAAAYRFLRINRTGGAWMLAGALLIFFVQVPIGHAILPPTLSQFAGWIMDVPGMAALRGAILGSALALIVVGVRFMFSEK